MAGDEAVRFIVATYGTKRLGMLLAHLWSITRSHPAARATISGRTFLQRKRALQSGISDVRFSRDAV
jgi:hypothetical protein